MPAATVPVHVHTELLVTVADTVGPTGPKFTQTSIPPTRLCPPVACSETVPLTVKVRATVRLGCGELMRTVNVDMEDS